MHYVLVVDDDLSYIEQVTSLLCSEAYTVTAVSTASEALRTLRTMRVDLILLDIQLPQGDGLDLCRRIRQSSTAPLIVVAARGDLHLKLDAFAAGADDYLPKPVDPDELLARSWAALRRAGRVSIGVESLHTADLILDPNEHQVTLVHNGTTIRLTPVESRLLRILLTHGGHTVSRVALLIKVWGDTGMDAELEVMLDQLRRKLEVDPCRPRLLIGVRGVGYKYQPSELQAKRPQVTLVGEQEADARPCRV